MAGLKYIGSLYGGSEIYRQSVVVLKYIDSLYGGSEIYRVSIVMGTWFAFIIFPCVASIQH